MAIHSLIYLGVMLLCLLDLLNLHILGFLLLLAVLHGVVDFAKHLSHPLFGRQIWLLFVLDQAVHCATIVLAAALLSPGDSAFIQRISHNFPLDLLFQYTSLLVVNVFGGIYFTAAVLQGVLDPKLELDEEQARASKVIGMAERFLITISVLIGQYVLIAFLIAAKAIIRYPEIRISKSERGAAHFGNYFLVGTLISYCWAIGITLIFKQLFF